MFKQAKQMNVNTVAFSPSRGLNYIDAPTNIQNNECRRATNFIYDANTFILTTRPGISCVTSAALSSTPIRKIYCYEKSSTESYLMAAIGTELYYLNTTASAWASTGVTLNDNATVPSMLVFNGKLLIGDGGEIKTWDGSSAGLISGSPHATALCELKGRVVCNDATDFDAVNFSAVEDETTWSDGTSEALRAGYGDGMKVNALTPAPGGNDLIVSKILGKRKTIYRVNIESATTSEWYAAPLAINNAAQNNCMITAANDVFFADTNGFKSLRGVQEYGDIQVASLGHKIAAIFESEPSIDEVVYIPIYASIWILNGTSGRVFIYHPLVADERGIGAFTDAVFSCGRIRSMCQYGSDVYLAGQNGLLYKFDSALSTDENTYGSTAYFNSVYESKTFTFPEAGLLRRLRLYFTPKKSGSAKVYAVTPENKSVLLKTITLSSEGMYLYDATGDLYDATEELYELGSDPWFETTLNRVRSRGIGFIIQTTSGRVGINQISAEFGMVGGH